LLRVAFPKFKESAYLLISIIMMEKPLTFIQF
jgi:hypothetical protein